MPTIWARSGSWEYDQKIYFYLRWFGKQLRYFQSLIMLFVNPFCPSLSLCPAY